MGSISSVFEEVPAFVLGVELADVTDGLPEGLDRPGADASEMGLELCEGHFDRIKVWTVRRQEEEPGSPLLEKSLGLCALVAGKVIQDHHVAWLQGRGELCLDIGVEDLAVHGLVDQPWCGQ